MGLGVEGLLSCGEGQGGAEVGHTEPSGALVLTPARSSKGSLSPNMGLGAGSRGPRDRGQPGLRGAKGAAWRFVLPVGGAGGGEGWAQGTGPAEPSTHSSLQALRSDPVHRARGSSRTGSGRDRSGEQSAE